MEPKDPLSAPENMDYFVEEYPNIFEKIDFQSSTAHKIYILLEKIPVKTCLGNEIRFILTHAGIVTMTGDPSLIWEINGKQEDILDAINSFSNTQQDFLNSKRGIQDGYLQIPGEKEIRLSYTQYAEDVGQSSLISALGYRYHDIGDTTVE